MSTAEPPPTLQAPNDATTSITPNATEDKMDVDKVNVGEVKAAETAIGDGEGATQTESKAVVEGAEQEVEQEEEEEEGEEEDDENDNGNLNNGNSNIMTTSPEIMQRYRAATATIGKALQSKAAVRFRLSGDPRIDFITDHQHFMQEIGHPFKLRRIGGGELNIYGLYRAVLDRGGLQSVIFKRAFKMVAKTLQLPKTCTSAAFILRSEYEKLLYAYEQKHVWNRDYKDLPPLIQSDRRKGMPIRSLPIIPMHITSGNFGNTNINHNSNHNNNIANNFNNSNNINDKNSNLLNSQQPAPAAAIHPLQQQNNHLNLSSAPTASNNISTGLKNTSTATPIIPNSSITPNSMNISNLNTAPGVGSVTRSRRHAAQAVSNAVAAAAVSDDPFAYPLIPNSSSKRRLTGFDERNIDMHEEQLVDDIVHGDHQNMQNMPHDVYTPGQAGERERVVQALQSPIHDDVAWALGTLNALSFDVKNSFIVPEFPGILDALHKILDRYMDDISGKRMSGMIVNNNYNVAGNDVVEYERSVPRIVPVSSLDIRNAGDNLLQQPSTRSSLTNHNLMDVTQSRIRHSSLQKYGKLFNITDPIAVDREQCAVVTGNILRNMSFYDRNAITLATCNKLLRLTSEMIEHISVTANLRDALMDTWINVSPYMNASEGYGGHAVLHCCIRLLDPFKEGADMARFTNCGEVLARLAASPERNEKAITDTFDIMLPRLVDMLGGRQRKYVNAGLAALCNLSAFDWPARDEIARVPRALDRLVVMLGDPELAPRAAVTLLNLAESPSNRSVLMVYERRLAEHALTPSPAADTVCNILFALEYD